MEGPEKRIKTTDGDSITMEALQNLSVDLQVNIMSHAEDLQDLFTIGRTHLKTLLKKKDVFGKWCRNQCRVPDIDEAVKEVFRYGYTEDVILIIEFAHPDRLDDILYNRDIVLICSDDHVQVNVTGYVPRLIDRLKNIQEWNYEEDQDGAQFTFYTKYPIFKFLELIHMVKISYTDLQMILKGSFKHFDFSQQWPFDVLTLVTFVRHLTDVYRRKKYVAKLLKAVFSRDDASQFDIYFHFNLLRVLLVNGLITVKEMFD